MGAEISCNDGARRKRKGRGNDLVSVRGFSLFENLKAQGEKFDAVEMRPRFITWLHHYAGFVFDRGMDYLRR